MESVGKAVNREEDEQIMAEILKELLASSGGETCFCSYPVFQAVYHAAEQGSEPGCVMLCSLTEREGQPLCEAPEKLSECLMEAVKTNIPGWGVACRYSREMCLLLLAGAGKEESEEVGRRIEADFLESCPEAGIRWKVNRIMPPPYEGKERRRSAKMAGSMPL